MALTKIEQRIEEIKRTMGYAQGDRRYELACELHDLNNNLGIANKLAKKIVNDLKNKEE